MLQAQRGFCFVCCLFERRQCQSSSSLLICSGEKLATWRSCYRYQDISGMLRVFGWVKVIYWDPVKSTLPSYSPRVTHHYITENGKGADQSTSKLKRVNGCTVRALWWAHIPGGMKTELTSLEKWKCVLLSIHSWLGLNRHGSRSLSQSLLNTVKV